MTIPQVVKSLLVRQVFVEMYNKHVSSDALNPNIRVDDVRIIKLIHLNIFKVKC